MSIELRDVFYDNDGQVSNPTKLSLMKPVAFDDDAEKQKTDDLLLRPRCRRFQFLL